MDSEVWAKTPAPPQGASRPSRELLVTDDNSRTSSAIFCLFSTKSPHTPYLVCRGARANDLTTAIAPLSRDRFPPTTHVSSVTRVIRDAMVNVMLATTPQCGALLATPPLHTGGVEESDVADGNCEVEGRWSKAVLATNAVLPRTTSTCMMWCAIALGAIVRGTPLNHVGGLPMKLTACDSALSAMPT